MAECKSCGARVRWVRTVKGTAMPIDPFPVPGGNVVLDRDEETGAEVARIVPRVKEIRRHVTHWVTCKNPPARTREKEKAAKAKKEPEKRAPEQGRLFPDVPDGDPLHRKW